MNCCSLCGTEITDLGMIVDMSSNHLIAGGRSVKVLPKIAEFIHIVAKSFPNYVHEERILALLYGSSDRAPQSRILPVWAHCSRKVLKGTGFTLENATGKGYRLARVV